MLIKIFHRERQKNGITSITHPQINHFLIWPLQKVFDVVQTKTSPFSTGHFIWVNYKVFSQLYHPILLQFSYLNSARHNLVIELCREHFLRVPEKINLKFFRFVFLVFWIMHIFTFISPEIPRFCGPIK